MTDLTGGLRAPAAEAHDSAHTYQRYDGGGYTPEYDATLADAFKAGAEWRDRMLNWARDLVQAGLDRPEEAVNILKRLKELI